MRQTTYHPKVPSEVREIVEDYESISERLADDFWTELTTAISFASEHPERHHFDASGRRRYNLTRFPYHFLFRVFEGTVRSTVVRHHRRRPDIGSRRS
jgi:plasmid stabilization system protein ParE